MTYPASLGRPPTHAGQSDAHAGHIERRTGLRLRSQDFDPKKLLYYAEVIEQGSIKRAARILGLSQPALSISMNRLEAFVGLKLMERGSWGVTPTAYGDMLYSHARMIRDEIELAERNLFTEHGNNFSPIRFGCVHSLGSNVVPAAIARWRADFPGQELRVIEAVQFDLLNGLLRRELDLFVGFTECYQLVEGLRQRVLFRDRLCVVARPAHPLFAGGDLTLHTLAKYPWVFVPSGPFHMNFEIILERVGITLKGGNTVSDSFALMKTLINCDDHLGLMPAHAIQNEIADGRLAVLPITIPEFARNIALFVREGHDLHISSRTLIDEIQAVGTEWSRAHGTH